MISKYIRVIPEGRTNDQECIAARELLRTADVIAFLGFSYDQSNLNLLDASKTCRKYVPEPLSAKSPRTVVGTVYGLTAAETELAVRLTAGAGYSPTLSYHANKPNPNADFFDNDCITLLRKTLIF